MAPPPKSRFGKTTYEKFSSERNTYLPYTPPFRAAQRDGHVKNVGEGPILQKDSAQYYQQFTIRATAQAFIYQKIIPKRGGWGEVERKEAKYTLNQPQIRLPSLKFPPNGGCLRRRKGNIFPTSER